MFIAVLEFNYEYHIESKNKPTWKEETTKLLGQARQWIDWDQWLL